MNTLIEYFTKNPDMIVGLIGWLLTSEVLPLLPGRYNGIIQGVLRYLMDRMPVKE